MIHSSKYKENQDRGGIWKSEEKITQIRLAFSLIFLQNTGLFEKNVQTLIRRTSSDFKTPRSFGFAPCIFNSTID